ncbi:hypothetical protein [Vibrio nereis]|uniref:hypothetical protein n=1 Tax=Vibrio nereis TaxID=693 RepID=UPI0012E13780|nr:hypothetical protein [Vibrio nereis]
MNYRTTLHGLSDQLDQFANLWEVSAKAELANVDNASFSIILDQVAEMRSLKS